MTGKASPDVNASVKFALDRLCAAEKTTYNKDEEHSQQSKPLYSTKENLKREKSLPPSPNEKGISNQSENPDFRQPRLSFFRPISIIVNQRNSSHHHEEDKATFEDCFFDLLFSAALSVYGSAANLTSFNEVGQFIAFFTLLWWSWICQTFYDVRYRSKNLSGLFSIVGHRCARIFLLGTWVAFSTCASEFSRGIYTNFSAVFALTKAALLADQLIATLDTSPAQKDLTKDGKRASRFACHFVSITASTVSLLCWCASRFLTASRINEKIKAVNFTLWTLSIAVEIASHVFVETCGPYQPLSETHLVERLALFSLIIFGAGYENIGLALNAISPRESSISGGWRLGTVVNAVSAVAIIMLLFFGYFRWAVKRLHTSPLIVLSWSYLHIILHLASAVLVVGLSKVISTSNTAEVLRAFQRNPMQHLPHTPQWEEYAQNHFPSLVGFDAIPDITNVTNMYDFQVFAVQLTILATQGAVVPAIQEALYLVKSAMVFQGMKWPEALQTQLSTYYNLVQSVENPLTAVDSVRNNLYQFYWIFGCASVYMLVDVALKMIQGKDETSRVSKAAKWELAIRIGFALLLIVTQAAYVKLHDFIPNSGVITIVLPVLASILLAECLVQSCIANARYLKKKVVATAKEKRDALASIREAARRGAAIQRQG